ncbi:unnamed protein product [Aphanomyces euteiches]
MKKTSGTTLRIGKNEFIVPEYSPFSKFYYITFNNVVEPEIQAAILAKLQELTNCVVTGFNPSMHNLLKTTQFRVLFDSEEPPEALAPTDGSDPLREIEIKSPTTKISKLYIFQHRLRSLNEFLPPSVKARQDAKAAKKQEQEKQETDAQETENSSQHDDKSDDKSGNNTDKSNDSNNRTSNGPPNNSKSELNSNNSTNSGKNNGTNSGGQNSKQSPNKSNAPRKNPSDSQRPQQGSSDPPQKLSEVTNKSSSQNDPPPVDNPSKEILTQRHADTESNATASTADQSKSNENEGSKNTDGAKNTHTGSAGANNSAESTPPGTQGKIPKHAFIISAAAIPTNNRFAILDQYDAAATTKDTSVPIYKLDVVTKTAQKKRQATSPLRAGPKKIPVPSKPSTAKIKAQLSDLKTKLNQMPSPIIFHEETITQPGLIGNFYMSPQESNIAEELISSRGIVRLMAGVNPKKPIDDHNLRSCFKKLTGASPTAGHSPTQLFQAMCDNEADYTLRRSIAAIDLFLSNRAPEAYANDEYLNLCLNAPVHRWPSCNLITDACLVHIIASKPAERLHHHKIENELDYVLNQIELHHYDVEDCFDTNTDALMTLHFSNNMETDESQDISQQ